MLIFVCVQLNGSKLITNDELSPQNTRDVVLGLGCP